MGWLTASNLWGFNGEQGALVEGVAWVIAAPGQPHRERRSADVSADGAHVRTFYLGSGCAYRERDLQSSSSERNFFFARRNKVDIA